MSRSLFRSARRLAKDRRGMAALEFALIGPVMVLLFFGTVEGSNALVESRRATQAANTLADLAAQETELTPALLTDLFSGVSQIMQRPSASTTIRVVSLVFDPVDNRVEVHWSRDNAGGQPYAPGSVYTGISDQSLFGAGSSLMVAEVRYTWTPTLTGFLIHGVTFNKQAMRWPRRAPRVQFCPTPTTCTS